MMTAFLEGHRELVLRAGTSDGLPNHNIIWQRGGRDTCGRIGLHALEQSVSTAACLVEGGRILP